MSEKETQEQQDEITEETAQEIFKNLEHSLLGKKTSSEKNTTVNTIKNFDLIESWGEGFGRDKG